MLYREISPDVFEPWRGGEIDGVMMPSAADVTNHWSDAERAAAGLYIPVPLGDVPDGMQVVGPVTVARVSGTVRFVQAYEAIPEETLATRKARLKDQVESHGNALRRAGFTWDFGTLEAPDPQTLQLREPGTPTSQNDDEKNWSASLGAYTAAVVGGQGTSDGAIFRTQGNETYTRTYVEGVTILTAMFAWIASILHVVWSKKDAIDAAVDAAALDVLEAAIEDGWPA